MPDTGCGIEDRRSNECFVIREHQTVIGKWWCVLRRKKDLWQLVTEK
jgi:hypothetical protein